MLYQICPRCHFRLQATKHICSTCGQALHVKKTDTAPDAANSEEVAEGSTEKKKSTETSFWKSLFSAT